MISAFPRKTSGISLQTDRIQALLETDRIWSAYALADLDPEHAPYSEWHINQQALLLRYTGLTPPILFALGNADQLDPLLAKIPGGDYQISFPENLLDCISLPMQIKERTPMWRMHYIYDQTVQEPTIKVTPLSSKDIPHIIQLYQGQAAAPDGFHPRQIELGPFAGIREGGQLIATAGVHVLSTSQNVAAVGNIFTHPDYRRKGYAEACTRAVLIELVRMKIQTIVLNVGQKNKAAIQLYQKMGFEPYCRFEEGFIVITQDST